MDWELWGTFSVRDHLRPRAFVADVLLYDRLVVPVPPQNDEAEVKRWADHKWRPERQRRLLSLIGPQRLVPISWDHRTRTNWEARYQNALGEEDPSGVERGAVRLEIASAAAFDVSAVARAREVFAANSRPDEELDELAYHTTRMLLVDWSSQRNDAAIFRSLPPVQVDAVSAYGSHTAFRRDHRLDCRPAEWPSPQSGLLNVFGWEFLVPADSQRSDDDLLKEAVDLASLPETQRHRRLFHEWRRGEILANRRPEEAQQEMVDAIACYHNAVARSNTFTKAKWACAVVSAVASVGAVAVPLLAIPGAFAGLGAFAISEAERRVLPENLRFAAMFHDAQRRLG